MTAQEEAQNILHLTQNNIMQSMQIVETQLNTLYTRAQVLLSLAGIVITVTGFSGRIIAGTTLTGQILIISGLATVLFSALWVYSKVMGIKWITGELKPDAIETLVTIIERRNKKTKAYCVGGKILGIGLFLYCTAVATMLLNPVM